MAAPMSDRFRTRQLAQLALVANALRPVPGAPASFPAFFSGWLTTELSPHLLALTALDTTAHLLRPRVSTRRDALGTVVAAANLAGYSALIAGGRRAGQEVERALVDELGPQYRDAITRDPRPDDL